MAVIGKQDSFCFLSVVLREPAVRAQAEAREFRHNKAGEHAVRHLNNPKMCLKNMGVLNGMDLMGIMLSETNQRR